MKKLLIIILLFTTAAGIAQTKQDTVMTDDSGFEGYYYGVPLILVIIVAFLAYKFLYERKKK